MKRTRNRATSPTWIDWVLLGALAVGAIGLVVAQVLTVGDSTTKLELSLFNVLQFIISLGFGWSVTRIVTNRQFEESLKGFAFSAYRRILDIGSLVRVLESQVAASRSRYAPDRLHELDQISGTLAAADLTIQSSILDWADVIGPELQVLEELKSLKTERAILEHPGVRAEAETSVNRWAELEGQIRALERRLPEELRPSRTSSLSPGEAATMLSIIHRTGGGLILGALFEPEHEQAPISREGSVVSVGLHPEAEDGRVAVFDPDGNPIGGVTNRLGSIGTRKCDYPTFASAVGALLGGRHATGKIVALEPEPWQGRRLFKVKLDQDQLPGQEDLMRWPGVRGKWEVVFPGKGVRELE